MIPLPHPREIPRVTQTQILRLYNLWVRGQEDEELLSEVESRILARAEVFFDLNKIRRSVEASAGRSPVVLSSGKRFVPSKISRREVYDALDRYSIQESDNYEIWEGVYEEMRNARNRSYRTRMVALDKFIATSHAYGPVAGTWIEDSPLAVEDFLYRLSNKRGPGMIPRDMFVWSSLEGFTLPGEVESDWRYRDRQLRRPKVRSHVRRRR